MKYIKFPEIDQFRHVVKSVTSAYRYAGKDEEGNAVYNKDPLPTLRFIGTVKLHGTNAGVSLDCKTGEIGAQSRNNVLSLLKDNAGWCANVLGNRREYEDLFTQLRNRFEFPEGTEQITIFGEWCGGNIQKGVALTALEKMFVVFAAAYIIEGETKWVPVDYVITGAAVAESKTIRNIFDFETFSIDIDFNRPELAQNELIEMTLKVENECPVGAALGSNGIGEGIVFSCETEHGRFVFKSKGEKHSVSKVTKLNAVDVEEINNIKEFVSKAVPEPRLTQGLDYLREQNMTPEDKNVGHFIKWVVGDVFKEESDTIAMNGLDAKKVSKEISNVARKWYFDQLVTA